MSKFQPPSFGAFFPRAGKRDLIMSAYVMFAELLDCHFHAPCPQLNLIK